MRSLATMKPKGQAPALTTLYGAAQMGEALKARRRELGYTQKTVADMMNCSARLVSDMEHGKATVGFDRMIAYANGLGMDVTLTVRGRQL